MERSKSAPTFSPVVGVPVAGDLLFAPYALRAEERNHPEQLVKGPFVVKGRALGAPRPEAEGGS